MGKFLFVTETKVREVSLQNLNPHPRNTPVLHFFLLANLPKKKERNRNDRVFCSCNSNGKYYTHSNILVSEKNQACMYKP